MTKSSPSRKAKGGVIRIQNIIYVSKSSNLEDENYLLQLEIDLVRAESKFELFSHNRFAVDMENAADDGTMLVPDILKDVTGLDIRVLPCIPLPKV